MTELSFSRPVEGAALVVASYGGGLDSTAMLFAAAHGLIEGRAPDFALHADVEFESEAIRETVNFMKGGNVLPFPVIETSGGNLRFRLEEAIARRLRNAIPFWTIGEKGERGQLRRACTRDFKVRPQERFIRHKLGYPAPRRVPKGVVVEQWLGINAGEVFRATPSGKAWIVNRWPLLELGWKRSDCEAFLRDNGYPVPTKSRCVACPFTSDARWLEIKREDGPEWREAIAVDHAIRGGFLGSRQPAYVHPSLVPLEVADFDPLANRDLFNHECQGRCGT